MTDNICEETDKSQPWCSRDKIRAMQDILVYLRVIVHGDLSHQNEMQELVQRKMFNQIPQPLTKEYVSLCQRVLDAYQNKSVTIHKNDLDSFFMQCIPTNTKLPLIVRKASWFYPKDAANGTFVTCLADITESEYQRVMSHFTKLALVPSGYGFQAIRRQHWVPEEYVDQQLSNIKTVLLEMYPFARDEGWQKLESAIREATWEIFKWWFQKRKEHTEVRNAPSLVQYRNGWELGTVQWPECL